MDRKVDFLNGGAKKRGAFVESCLDLRETYINPRSLARGERSLIFRKLLVRLVNKKLIFCLSPR